jgi:hypothetical protein
MERGNAKSDHTVIALCIHIKSCGYITPTPSKSTASTKRLRLFCLSGESFADASDHDACEGEVVEEFEAGVKSFVVSGESSETCGPGEVSFHDPAAWQQHKVAFGHGVFHDFMRCCRAASAAFGPV